MIRLNLYIYLASYIYVVVEIYPLFLSRCDLGGFCFELNCDYTFVMNVIRTLFLHGETFLLSCLFLVEFKLLIIVENWGWKLCSEDLWLWSSKSLEVLQPKMKTQEKVLQAFKQMAFSKILSRRIAVLINLKDLVSTAPQRGSVCY